MVRNGEIESPSRKDQRASWVKSEEERTLELEILVGKTGKKNQKKRPVVRCFKRRHLKRC